MDDMTAFENRMAEDARRVAGPPRSVDAAAVFAAIPTSRSPKWRFESMFSATKLLVAGAIVALFGGFLLTGILTMPQEEEAAPAAVTASPTAQSEPDEVTEPPDPQPSPMTTEELLSGMVTEEVEPGVYRVVHDGVRDLTPYLTSMMQTVASPGILAGDDGSVWVGTTPLGGEDVEFPPGWGPIKEGGFPPGWSFIDFVTADGTAWAAHWSHDGERWTEHPEPPAEHVGWQSRDGTVLVTWPDVWPDEPDWDEPDERRWTVARLDGDEWRLLGEPLTLPGDGSPEFYVTDEGDLWAWIWSNMDGIWMSRWDDGQWIRDDSRMRVEGPFETPRWRDHVAPDGSRWWNSDPDWDRESDPCRSVVRFDGLREDRFLTDVCADSIDVSPDGSVWALARTGPDEDPTWGLYVITPEAAATERPATSVRADILPGATLTVMEVEPGVFRVLEDGVRDPSSLGDQFVAGHDGSIWLGFVRLGYPAEPWQKAPQGAEIRAFTVAPDGTVWVLDHQPVDESSDTVRLRSYEDGSWTVHREAIDRFGPWTIAPDGTAWAVYPAEDEGEGLVVARLGADGWEPLEGSPPGEPHRIYVTRDGEVWLVDLRLDRLWRYREDAGEWQELAVDTEGLDIDRWEATVMADGTVWVAGEEARTTDGEGDPFLMRFDDTEWQRWGPADGVPSASSPEERFTWDGLGQAPDGALWVNYGIRKPEGLSIFRGSVERFDVDGSTWRRFLPERDIHSSAVAPDGSVWLRTDKGLYVITPEALAATE